MPLDERGGRIGEKEPTTLGRPDEDSQKPSGDYRMAVANKEEVSLEASDAAAKMPGAVAPTLKDSTAILASSETTWDPITTTPSSPVSKSHNYVTSPTTPRGEDATYHVTNSPASSPETVSNPTSRSSLDVPASRGMNMVGTLQKTSTSDSLVLQQRLVPLVSALSAEPSPDRRTDSRRSSTSSTQSSTRRKRAVLESPGATFVESANGQKTLNQYTIKQVIGKGAFGTVSLAVDGEGNEWAIKDFSKSRLRKKNHSNLFRGVRGRGRKRGNGAVDGRSSGPSSKDHTDPWYLIRGEFAIMKKLDHPNVVTLHEVLDDPLQDSLWMVFDMCHNGVSMRIDLDQDAVPYTEEQARNYFRQLILGIEYLHANDICHRDIKPDNLLLTKENNLVIVDFGISQMFTGGTDCMKMSGGSPAFMAPEMCTPSGTVSGRAADLWAMGVTLYCFCFGRLPFKGRTIVDIFSAISTDEPQIPSTASPDLRDLLKKLLEKDPEKRMKMPQLREHPWVTAHDAGPLPCTENTERVVEQVTDDDLEHAVRKIHSIYMVLKAVARMRKSGSSTNLKAASPVTGSVASRKGTGGDTVPPSTPLEATGALARLVLTDAPLTAEPEVSSVLSTMESYPDHAERSSSATSAGSGVSALCPASRSTTLDEDAVPSAGDQIPSNAKTATSPEHTVNFRELPTAKLQLPDHDLGEEQNVVLSSSPL